MMPPTCGSAGRPRPAERILRHQRMQGGVEDHDGRERRGRDRDASRETCGIGLTGNPP